MNDENMYFLRGMDVCMDEGMKEIRKKVLMMFWF